MPKKGCRRSLPKQQQQLLQPLSRYADQSGQKCGIQKPQQADDKDSADKPAVIGQGTSKQLEDGLADWWRQGERSTATTSRPQLQQAKQQQAQQQQQQQTAEQFYIGDDGAADVIYEADSDLDQARRLVSAPASIFGFGDDVHYESMDSDMRFTDCHDFDSGYSHQVSKYTDQCVAYKTSWADLQEESHDPCRRADSSDSGFPHKVSMYSDMASTYQDQFAYKDHHEGHGYSNKVSKYKNQNQQSANYVDKGHSYLDTVSTYKVPASDSKGDFGAHWGFDSGYSNKVSGNSDQVSKYQDLSPHGAVGLDIDYWKEGTSYSDKVSKYKDQQRAASGGTGSDSKGRTESPDSDAQRGFDSGYFHEVSRYSDNVGRGVLGERESFVGESSDYYDQAVFDSDPSNQVSTYQNAHYYIDEDGSGESGAAVDASDDSSADSGYVDKQAIFQNQVSYKNKLVPRVNTRNDGALAHGSVAYVDTKGGTFDSGYSVMVGRYKDQATQTDAVGGAFVSGFPNQVSTYKDAAVQADSSGAYIDTSFKGLASLGTVRPTPSARRAEGSTDSSISFGTEILMGAFGIDMGNFGMSGGLTGRNDVECSTFDTDGKKGGKGSSKDKMGKGVTVDKEITDFLKSTADAGDRSRARGDSLQDTTVLMKIYLNDGIRRGILTPDMLQALGMQFSGSQQQQQQGRVTMSVRLEGGGF